MRWRLALVAIAAALVASLASISMAATPTAVGDTFDSGGYAGSNGTSGGGWIGAWTEVGESDGPAAGAVRVKAFNGCSAKCLVVSGSLIYLGSGASRVAQAAGPNTATLKYSAHFDLLTTAVLTVQANADGLGWKTLAIRRGTGTFTDSIGTVNGDVAVRFVVTGLGLTGSTAVDDVEISFVPVPTSSSTTTTGGLGIPPITLPTIPTITIFPPTPTTTVVSSPSTTLSTGPSATTSTRPKDQSTTTTTRVGSSAVAAGGGGGPAAFDDRGVSVPSGTLSDVEETRPDGVVMHLDPGLMPTAMLSDEDVQVVAGLSVPFGMRTERLSLDLTLYLILGVTLAVVSALRFEWVNRKA